MIPRSYQIDKFVQKGKVLVIYGARRVGKTTLIQNYLKETPLKYKLVSGEDIRVQTLLSSANLNELLSFVEGYDLFVIDEGQHVKGIGLALKLLIDARSDLAIIATGSSSFELANQIGEPLTGRKRTLTLYPLSQLELQKLYNTYELKEKLEEWLIFWSYPEVVTLPTKQEKIVYLKELADSYLLKDILVLENIKHSKILLDLLRLLAFQIGQEVSFNELATTLGINAKTVERYIDLLEKTFIIFPLWAYSSNLRKEIRKKSKYYFWDLGIRNAIISQFNELSLRQDTGALWENFCIIERKKMLGYTSDYANSYFWRTYSKQEVDYIEEKDGKLMGYEFKWRKATAKAPPEWQQTYPNASFEVINQDNYIAFVCGLK